MNAKEKTQFEYELKMFVKNFIFFRSIPLIEENNLIYLNQKKPKN